MRIRILCGIILLLMAPLAASACTCVIDPFVSTCSKLRSFKGSALFVGTVLSIRQLPATTVDYISVQQQVKFAKLDSFFGSVGGTVTVTEDVPSGGSCGFPFKQGKTYLVEANGPHSDLHTGVCGLTSGPLNPQTAESIRFLKVVRDHPSGGIVFGTIRGYAGERNFVAERNRPLKEATVLLDVLPDRLPPMHERKEVSTDASGWYFFADLPAGEYTIGIVRPQGFLTPKSQTFRLDVNGCSQLDFRAAREGTH